MGVGARDGARLDNGSNDDRQNESTVAAPVLLARQWSRASYAASKQLATQQRPVGQKWLGTTTVLARTL